VAEARGGLAGDVPLVKEVEGHVGHGAEQRVRCHITTPYLSRPSGFVLPLSVIMIIGKCDTGPSPGNGIVKKSRNSARDKTRSATGRCGRAGRPRRCAGAARSTVFGPAANRIARHRASWPRHTHPAASPRPSPRTRATVVGARCAPELAVRRSGPPRAGSGACSGPCSSETTIGRRWRRLRLCRY
jgi:hypothetical protein